MFRQSHVSTYWFPSILEWKFCPAACSSTLAPRDVVALDFLPAFLLFWLNCWDLSRRVDKAPAEVRSPCWERRPDLSIQRLQGPINDPRNHTKPTVVYARKDSDICVCIHIIYYIILYYIILYHIILYCTVLYYIISYYIILYHIILYYIVLFYIMLYYIISYYIIYVYYIIDLSIYLSIYLI